MGGKTTVSAPAPDPAAQEAMRSNTEIAKLQYQSGLEQRARDNEFIDNFVKPEMLRQAKIGQEQYELGRQWGIEDRARGDAYYNAAMAYDPEATARENANRAVSTAGNDFNLNYGRKQNEMLRAMGLRGLSAAALGNNLVAAAAARSNAQNQAVRAGDTAIAAARAEKLNVHANAAGRANPMAGMGLAMQGSGMGMQGMNFAQGIQGQNASMFNASMGSALQANNSVANYGLDQQKMQMQANIANAQFGQGMFGSLMGAGMQMGGMYAASKFT
jgi:hypothetical protein